MATKVRPLVAFYYNADFLRKPYIGLFLKPGIQEYNFQENPRPFPTNVPCIPKFNVRPQIVNRTYYLMIIISGPLVILQDFQTIFVSILISSWSQGFVIGRPSFHLKKIEIAPKKINYKFSEYERKYEEFLDESAKSFRNPRRFTYTPIILCRGRKPS